MKVTMERRVQDDMAVYTVEVPRSDWVKARLDRIDWAVLLTPRKGIADVLQDLQLLAFRLEQQDESATGTETTDEWNHMNMSDNVALAWGDGNKRRSTSRAAESVPKPLWSGSPQRPQGDHR